MKDIKGIIVPLLTPIRADETPDLSQMKRLTEYVLDGGVDALFVNGTSGEFARFTVGERFALVEATVGAARGRAPVITGISDCGSRMVAENAKRALDSGAEAVVTTLPYYFPMRSATEQRLFIEHVLDRSKLPVLLYNIPVVVGCSIDPEVLETLAGHPNLYGIKDTGGDIAYLSMLIRRFSDRMRVYVGDERLSLDGMRLGASGLVPSLANAFPRLLSQMWHAFSCGDEATCLWCRDVMNRMNNALNAFSDSWMSPNIWRKEALRQMGVIDATFTSPSSPMSDADKAIVSAFVDLYQTRYCLKEDGGIP